MVNIFPTSKVHKSVEFNAPFCFEIGFNPLLVLFFIVPETRQENCLVTPCTRELEIYPYTTFQRR